MVESTGVTHSAAAAAAAAPSRPPCGLACAYVRTLHWRCSWMAPNHGSRSGARPRNSSNSAAAAPATATAILAGVLFIP